MWEICMLSAFLWIKPSMFWCLPVEHKAYTSIEKKWKGTSGEIVFLQASVANGAVFDALYCYCKTRRVWDCSASLWACGFLSQKCLMQKSGCVNPAVIQLPEIDGTESERETYKPCLAVLNIEGLTMQREREDQSSINFTLLPYP